MTPSPVPAKILKLKALVAANTEVATLRTQLAELQALVDIHATTEENLKEVDALKTTINGLTN